MTVDQLFVQDNHNNSIVQINNHNDNKKTSTSLFSLNQHHYQEYDDEDIEACFYQQASYHATQNYDGVENNHPNEKIKTLTTTTRNCDNPLSTDQPLDHNQNFRSSLPSSSSSSSSSSLRSWFCRMIVYRGQPSLPNYEEDNDDNVETSSSSSNTKNTDAHNTSRRSIKSTVREEHHNMYDEKIRNESNHIARKRYGRSPIRAAAPNTIDKDAVGYALRICIVLTVSVLFVLLSPNDPYPQGSWVYITCCMVSWFPSSMDAASVLKKTVHRIVGTTIGAILALGVGFMVAQIDVTTTDNSGVRYQATVLGLSFGILSFGLTFVVVHWKAIFGGYSYASILVLMTFGIAVIPFYNNETPEEKERMWEIACYRVANVIVGCLLSAAGSVLIMPKSTQDAIEVSVARQIQFAGKSSNAVLQSAYHVFTQTAKPIPLTQVIGSVQTGQMKQKKSQEQSKDEEPSNEEEQIIDTVHDQYAAAIKDLQASKALFPLLKYDPFHLWRCCDKGVPKTSPFQADEAAVNLARAFRVQTTVILLDSIVRNDTDNKGQEHFTAEQLTLFSRVGYLIKEMLTLPFCQKNSECALELCSILGEVRQHALEASNNLQTTLRKKYTSITSDEDDNHRDKSSFSSATSVEVPEWCLEKFVDELESPNSGMPMSMASASILFLELLEHLILRTLRLYMRNRNHESLSTLFTVGDAATKREQSYDGDDDGDDDGGD